MRRLWMMSLKGDRSPIIIFNRKARVLDGQIYKPRTIGIPNMHLSVRCIYYWMDHFLEARSEDLILIKCIQVSVPQGRKVEAVASIANFRQGIYGGITRPLGSIGLPEPNDSL